MLPRGAGTRRAGATHTPGRVLAGAALPSGSPAPFPCPPFPCGICSGAAAHPQRPRTRAARPSLAPASGTSRGPGFGPSAAKGLGRTPGRHSRSAVRRHAGRRRSCHGEARPERGRGARHGRPDAWRKCPAAGAEARSSRLPSSQSCANKVLACARAFACVCVRGAHGSLAPPCTPAPRRLLSELLDCRASPARPGPESTSRPGPARKRMGRGPTAQGRRLSD